MTKILYQNESGGVCRHHPNRRASHRRRLPEDVPAGVAYLIVEDDAIPSDRTFRGAWEADFSNPDGYGIGADAWFAQQEASE
jgi:hypothetical protein